MASSTGTDSSSGTISSTGTASSAAEATLTPGVINFDINLTNGGALARSVAYVASINLSPPDKGSSDGEFWVQLDTGSSDLWIETNGLSIQNDGQDHSWLNITHGHPWAAGNMSYAPVTFGGYSIPEQIFLNSNSSSGFGTQGVLGLGFDSNSSLVSKYMGDHNSNYTGSLTPLTNIINQNFSGSNGPGFITLDVNHCPGIEAPEMYFDDNNNDTKTIGNGTLTIGSVLPQYASAMDGAPHLTVPQRPSQSENDKAYFESWHIPVDSVAFEDQKYDVGPDGRVDGDVNTTTALIDSGSSLSFVSQKLAYFIYSNIDNSKPCEKDDPSTNVLWLVPCTSAPKVSFTFGGQDVRIDPLALTDVVQLKQDGSDHVACIGTFRAHDTPTGLDATTPYNYTLGDPFLRNVYTRFDYGSATTDGNFTDPPAPFVSFVSKVNGTDDAINDAFTAVRQKTLQFFDDHKMTELSPVNVDCQNLAAYYL